MTKSLLAFILGFGMLFFAAGLNNVSAHSTHPCEDSGGSGNSDYAKHHISFLAHEQGLGEGGHKPGEHKGFSLCLGVHD